MLRILRHLLHVSGSQWLEEAEAAVVAGDETRPKKVCHSLKGTAATVCANAFSEAGAELGKVAREGRMSEAPRGLEHLKKEFNRIVEWARSSDLDLMLRCHRADFFSFSGPWAIFLFHSLTCLL